MWSVSSVECEQCEECEECEECIMASIILMIGCLLTGNISGYEDGEFLPLEG